jgi:hypothetical protein
LGVVLVVPQIWSGYLLLQFSDLGAFAIGVDDGLDRAQGPVKVCERDSKVGSGHNDPLYLRTSCSKSKPFWLRAA